MARIATHKSLVSKQRLDRQEIRGFLRFIEPLIAICLILTLGIDSANALIRSSGGILSIRESLVLIGLLVLTSIKVQAALLDVESSVLGDTAHFEFRGQETWNYDIKKINEGKKSWIELRVPALGDAALSKIKSFKGGPVTSVQVNSAGPDRTHVLKLVLDTGDVESFDYLTDQPSRLILDLYPQKPKEKVKATPKAADQKVVNGPQKVAVQDRKPATADVLIVKNETLEQLKKSAPSTAAQSGIYDGGDPGFSRFSIQEYEIREDAIIQSSDKDYIEFPMLHMNPEELEILSARKPVYEVTPANSEDTAKIDENKMMRLLATLFERKRYLVFLKTSEWFFEKYPKSEYDEMVRFMRADAHYALWEQNPAQISHFDLAMFHYKEALEKYPQSMLAERTLLLTGFANLERGDSLGTLRVFQQTLAKHPSSPNRDLARLAIAEAYLRLNLHQDAIALYNEIEKDAKRSEDRTRAAYLKGDVYYKKKDDVEAIRSYQAALEKYPDAKKDYPNALYNQGAAYFRTRDFRKSLGLYREFLETFPSHNFSGYAMTRVGELLDILGADSSRSNGAYLEAYFRYGNEPSSVVARMRLLISRMPQMKKKEVEKAIEDLTKMAENSDLPKIKEFAVLQISEGSARRENYEDAINRLVKYYQENPTTADTKKLESRIVRYINEKMTGQVRAGQSIEALKTHNQYAGSWLKNSNRIDTKFWIGKAFENSGVPSESEKLYLDTLNKVYAMKGSKEGKERSVLEKIPDTDEIHLRLSSSLYAQGQWNKAFEQLTKVEKPEKLSEKDQIERVSIYASLLDKKGESELALRYLSDLIKTWRGVPALVAGPYYDAGLIEEKLGRKDQALVSFERVNELMKDSGQVSPMIHSKALERIVQIRLSQNQPDKATPVIEALLKEYENTRPLSSYRYQLGQLYFKKGELQKATEVWEPLKSDKSGTVWYQLAQEKLKGSAWDKEYKKYVERIPAMEKKSDKGGGD